MSGKLLLYVFRKKNGMKFHLKYLFCRYDDLMKNLPLPEYSDPEGNLNLASHLPSFFVRPDLGPRLCCAYGMMQISSYRHGGTVKGPALSSPPVVLQPCPQSTSPYTVSYCYYCCIFAQYIAVLV